MKMTDYGNVITIRGADGTKEFHLPAQRIEGLNYLFEILQNASLEQDALGYLECGFNVKIFRHGISRMHADAEEILATNWVEKIFNALND